MMSKLGGSVSRSRSFDSIKAYQLTQEELNQVKKHFMEEKKRQRRKKKKNMNDMREKYFLQYLDTYKPEPSVNLTDTNHENSGLVNQDVDSSNIEIYNKFNNIDSQTKHQWKEQNLNVVKGIKKKLETKKK